MNAVLILVPNQLYMKQASIPETHIIFITLRAQSMNLTFTPLIPSDVIVFNGAFRLQSLDTVTGSIDRSREKRVKTYLK